MWRITAALLLIAALAGCAAPAERTSPCACDWVPVDGNPDEGSLV